MQEIVLLTPRPWKKSISLKPQWRARISGPALL
jgi:hypothetical protein